MANPQPPIELYIVHPFYARAEDVIGSGVSATDDHGKVNMLRLERGKVVKIKNDPARDLIIAKQAIDNKNAKTSDREEARAIVEERTKFEANQAKAEAEGRQNETSLKEQLAQLRQEVVQLKKKAA